MAHSHSQKAKQATYFYKALEEERKGLLSFYGHSDVVIEDDATLRRLYDLTDGLKDALCILARREAGDAFLEENGMEENV